MIIKLTDCIGKKKNNGGKLLKLLELYASLSILNELISWAEKIVVFSTVFMVLASRTNTEIENNSSFSLEHFP